MPQDENTGTFPERGGGPKKTLKIAAMIAAAAVAFALSTVTAGLGRVNVAVSFVCFTAAAVIMTFLFLHVRSAAVLIPPAVAIAAALALGGDVLTTLIAASLILVLAGTAALMLLKRAAPFIIFLTLTALYFGATAFFAVAALRSSFGSVSAGIDEIRKAVAAAVSDVLANMNASGALTELGADSGSLGEAVFALFPSAVMIFSMIASAVHTGILKLLTRAAGTRDLLFAEKLSTPVPFAVIFIVTIVLSFLSGTIPPPGSYVIVNLHFILMTYFAGIGFLELVRTILRSRLTAGKKTAAIAVVVTAVAFGWFAFAAFFPVLLPVLSYFGVFRTVKNRKRAG